MSASRPLIDNPILRGFNPDPSILRVGEDYYVATSTFEWYPGVQIHHSRDLVNWRLLTRPLRRQTQLDMRGEPDSCGIWAPCLTHSDGKFFLVYTDVKRYGGMGASGCAPRDMHNYVVTADQIDGEWSEPVYLNASGFDPSLFHDTDGRKYVLNMLWDHRPDRNRFAGIVMQEYSVEERSLIGERRLIFKGTSLGYTEAPHLYRRGDYYYLITAEGGTGFGHAVTLARSKSLWGAYELQPGGPLLTSRSAPDAPLQRAGHADWVDTPDGETYLVYLCGRPLPGRGRCTLGRETAIARVEWSDDQWPRISEGGPALQVQAPALPPHPFEPEPTRTDFSSSELPLSFQWLRTPHSAELFSLSEAPGKLRLYGRESLGSQYDQGLVARRWQSHCFTCTVALDFEPEHFQQMAGLVAYYGGSKFHYLQVTKDEEHGKHLRVVSRAPVPVLHDTYSPCVRLPEGKRIELRMEVDYERLLFAYRVEGEQWQTLPLELDASILSDEATTGFTPNFTGAFAGMCCQDLSGTRKPADFDYFEYVERPFRAG